MNRYDELLSEMKNAVIEQKDCNMETYEWTYILQAKRYGLDRDMEKDLPEDRKLALYLYRYFHKYLRPEEQVRWMDESPQLVHDWDGELHTKYLEMAQGLLKNTDYDGAVDFINIIFKS